ncbi:MAG TPA: SulP family inorganic anion transporter [Methylococcaceae bacterium]|nr:SulP family inorganic anion transporter [Methylococcaceae bacterium]
MSQLPARPQTGLAGLIENWRHDLLAGFLVFLVALPLCLGIAMASGFPPMAGIVSAVVGGLLVSRINGSHVTITGPAAGLIVVILAAVQSLGAGDAVAGYRRTLAAIVLAGLLQTLLGYYKAGRLSAFFPVAVVRGMLAAIGIIIMAKQIHVMLGVRTDTGTLLQTIALIPASLSHFNPQIALIGAVGLGIMVGWRYVTHPLLRQAPAPLVVVVSGLVLGQVYDLDHHREFFSIPPHIYTLGPEYLLPITGGFADNVHFPDFSAFWTLKFWGAVIGITLVGSLESLLSSTAVDKLDPWRRQSDLNRDLGAVGIGNTLAGLLGGLPMIAEIVRSSAAVEHGARTGWANFFHGALLLLFVALFPAILKEIPLASLSALLVYTGYRLASPKEFARVLDVGWQQLAVFVVTIISILATDLLSGVLIGIAAKLLLSVLSGADLGQLFRIAYAIQPTAPDVFHVTVRGAALFSNIVALKTELAALPSGGVIVFDLSETNLIDHSVMEFIDQFCRDYQDNGGRCEIRGLDNHAAASEHPLAARSRSV